MEKDIGSVVAQNAGIIGVIIGILGTLITTWLHHYFERERRIEELQFEKHRRKEELLFEAKRAAYAKVVAIGSFEDFENKEQLYKAEQAINEAMLLAGRELGLKLLEFQHAINSQYDTRTKSLFGRSGVDISEFVVLKDQIEELMKEELDISWKK
jgi:hypothetical protein